MKTRPPRKATLPLGDFINDALPDIDDLLTPHGIDSAAFAAWFSPRLGSYRLAEAVKQQLPTRGEEAIAVQEIVGDLQYATAAIASIPIRSRAALGSLALRHNINLIEFFRRLGDDLLTLTVLLDQISDSISAGTGRRGRKPMSGRNALLAAVVAFLKSKGTKLSDAEGIAEELFVRCRIAVPADPHSLAKARRKAQPATTS